MKYQILKNQILKKLGTATIGFSLAACQVARVEVSRAEGFAALDVQTVDIGQIARQAKTSQEKSEQLALVAESLVRPNTLHVASAISREALSLNQFNRRAQLVDKVTQPVLALKGVLKRVLPIVSTRPERYAEYKRYLKEVQTNPDSPDFGSFLVDGVPDIKTESQVQSVIELYVDRMDELRDWLKENRKQPMTLSYYQEPGGSPCRALEIAPKKWRLENCSSAKKTTAVANLADFEVIRQQVGAIQVLIAMASAYSLDGFYRAAKNLPDGNNQQEVYNYLASVKGIGRLRSGQFFAMVPKVGHEFVTAFRLARKMQKQLCPRGDLVEGSRPGKVFHAGVCSEKLAYNGFDRLMTVIESLTAGNVTTAIFETSAGPKTAMLDLKSFTQAPPKDLRDIGAPQYNKCGQLQSLGDGTMGGFFVNGELNELIQSESNCDSKE